MENEDISPPAPESEKSSGYVDDNDEWNQAENRQKWISWVGNALRIALSIIVVLIGGFCFLFVIAAAGLGAGDPDIYKKVSPILIGIFVIVTLLLVGIWRIGR